MVEIGRGFGQIQWQDWSKKPDTKVVTQGKLIAKAGEFGGELNLDNLEEFSDIRGCILKDKGLFEKFKNLDLRDKYDVLITCSWDPETPWPPKDKMPSNFDLKTILDAGKNPGVGINNLQVNGAGVNVAIIDQPLLLNHQEYEGNLKEYNSIDCENSEPSLHGPAVASFFVGKNIGTARGANLHYWAIPMWKHDYLYYSMALEQIIEHNENKPPNEKIKVVSISKGLGPEPRFKNFDVLEKSLKKAREKGIIIITCGSDFLGAGCPPDKDRDNPENYDLCYFQKPYMDNPKSRKRASELVSIPMDGRTYANREGENKYNFDGSGSYSWGVPYLAGIVTLGVQVDPDLKEEDALRYIKETGTPVNKKVKNKKGELLYTYTIRLVNPKGFVDRVKLELKNKPQKTK